MELRSGRRLVYPTLEQRGGGHRRRSQQSSDDRINSLHEDLLLEILTRLRSVPEAVRAGAVCRCWRGRWTELPELTFRFENPFPVLSALAGITRPSLDLLDIYLMTHEMVDEDWAGQVSLLLRAAALVLPKQLMVCVLCPINNDYVVELPCFERTSYLSLHFVSNFSVMLPLSREFTALESLHLESCCIDLGALLPLCPCLRILNICNIIVSDIHADTVVIHSRSLEELSMEISNHDIYRIDIAAPVLKEVTLEVDTANGFSVSFSAPKVKKLIWGCSFGYVSVGFGQIWQIISIRQHELDDFHVVSLELCSSANAGLLGAEWSTAEVLAHLPVTVFSVLNLYLETKGGSHAFGPIMLRMLRIQPTIQRLKVILKCDKVLPCPVNCPCEQPINWRSEDVPLANLEIVEIRGLEGRDDEIDFLKIVFRCATVLRRLTITVSHDVPPSNNGYEKICSIMKERPDVECHIIASSSDL